MVQQQLYWWFAGSSMDVVKGCVALSGSEGGGGNEGLQELQELQCKDFQTSGHRLRKAQSNQWLQEHSECECVCVCVRTGVLQLNMGAKECLRSKV